jgi:rhodanese-related sulfurtransferase
MNTASAQSERSYVRIDVDTARQLLTQPDLLLLDARDAKAFATSRLPAATHLTRNNLDELLLRRAKQQPVLIYCYHGRSSQTYAKMFIDFGFTQVFSLDGGYEAWHQSQLTALQSWLQEHSFDANDMNSRLPHGMTPLMHASHRGEKSIVQLLIQTRTDIHAKNADGNNALWHACLSNSLPVVLMLIDAGIDVNNQNSHGATCLTCACLRGKETLVATLIAAGADPHFRTRDGFTAFDLATTVECARCLHATECGALQAAEVSPTV